MRVLAQKSEKATASYASLLATPLTSLPTLCMYVCMYVCMYEWMDGWMYSLAIFIQFEQTLIIYLLQYWVVHINQHLTHLPIPSAILFYHHCLVSQA